MKYNRITCKIQIIIFIVLLSWGTTFMAQLEHETLGYVPETNSLVLENLELWQNLKFGVLMTCGSFSQWGIVESWSICHEDYVWGERIKGSNPDNYFEYKNEYENLQTTFNPVKFDPDKWVNATKDAGIKINAIGEWIHVNSEAIYETRAIAPFKEAKICYTNKKNINTVYAIYMADKDETSIPSKIIISSFLPKAGTNINPLGFDKPLSWKKLGMEL